MNKEQIKREIITEDVISPHAVRRNTIIYVPENTDSSEVMMLRQRDIS